MFWPVLGSRTAKEQNRTLLWGTASFRIADNPARDNKGAVEWSLELVGG